MLPILDFIADALERRLGYRSNNCLINYYEDGNSTMGFHSDDVTQLAPETGIAILSLGSARDITFRNIADPEMRQTLLLEPGSLLWMNQAVQSEWMHAIRRQPGVGLRLSLTFRQLIASSL